MKQLNLTEKCKKYLGLKPYDNPENISRGDYFLAQELCEEYGEKVVQSEIDRLKAEEDMKR